MEIKVCLVPLYMLLLFTTPVRLQLCRKALDVVLLLDAGPDITDDDWNQMTFLSRDVSRNLRPSTFGTHVALALFGGNVTVVQRLGGTTLQIRGRLVSTLDSGRNLSGALDATRRLVLNNEDGDRPDVPDVLVLVTRGLSDDKNAVISQAKRLKSEGIRIETVGMTSTCVDQLREELQQISTDPDNVHNLMLTNRNFYSPVKRALVSTVCQNRVEATDQSLRLVGGSSNEGRLEVYIDEEWTTVCSVGWTTLNTEVACKQLGFLAGRNTYTLNMTSYHRRVGVSNIRCNGNETSLLQCSHYPFFHVDIICDHRVDVFLRCICADCADYQQRDNVRLEGLTSTSGRLEVFIPGYGWGGVCSAGWTTMNTRVVCRQLGFLDAAGTYQSQHRLFVKIALYHLSCSGNESTLFDCIYSTRYKPSCRDPIYIRCVCSDCQEFLLESPHQINVVTSSTAVFEWRFRQNVSNFQFAFLSQKNPQTLMYVENNEVVKENTRFKHRIEIINDDYVTVGFNLTNITVADMGMYSLYVPSMMDSKAMLIVSDFPEVPQPVIHRVVSDNVTLSWDLSAVRQLHDIDHEILLTTPRTGRLHLNNYITYWLPVNSQPRHRVPRPTDHLRPTIVIENLTTEDAGTYAVEIILTSFAHWWVNYSSQFVTELIVISDTDGEFELTGCLAAIIVLSVLFGISVIVITVLSKKYRKKPAVNNRILKRVVQEVLLRESFTSQNIGEMTQDELEGLYQHINNQYEYANEQEDDHHYKPRNDRVIETNILR